MKKIRIVEVGPRDGLQNEAGLKQLSLDELIEVRKNFIIGLADSGLEDVEAGAFVRADRIPQMSSTDKVLAKIQTERPDLWQSKKFWSLVPNLRGLELAMNAKVKHISVFTSTSDAFNQKNVQMIVEESLSQLQMVIKTAKEEKIKVRGYVSTVWGCPYSGATPPEKAKEVAEKLLEYGVEEVSLGDTIGVATPKQVSEVLRIFPKEWPLAVHFHDTRGTAIANCLQAIAAGIHVVDSSAGGLGGCPYAKGAAGNLATEDLLYMLNGMGFNTGVDIVKLCAASDQLAKAFQLYLPSRYFIAWKGSQ